MYKKLTIIIPTLNEAENISWVINTILNSLPDAFIIVADDGSSDGTQEIVLNYDKENVNIKLLDRSQKKHGLTASVIDAILQAKTQYFAVIDGDGQHPPEKIKDFLQELEKGAELVVGVREKVANKWGFSRRLMSKTATALAKMRLHITGIYCSDPVSGFFGGNTLLVQEVIKKNEKSFIQEGYKVFFDILKLKKWKLKEIPYIFGLRKCGESKIGKKQIIAFLKSIIH
ncbi:glycosyltransferase [Candidatus Woesearchaeota archaeon]|nr:glycosyltransferase [Candidatus Woesearchaeota archaeon]